MERWSTQWAHERITQWQREQPLSAHRHGYDREMLGEGIVQVCVKPYRARHRRFTDERALERIKIDARFRPHIFVPAERGTDV